MHQPANNGTRRALSEAAVVAAPVGTAPAPTGAAEPDADDPAGAVALGVAGTPEEAPVATGPVAWLHGRGSGPRAALRAWSTAPPHPKVGSALAGPRPTVKTLAHVFGVFVGPE